MARLLILSCHDRWDGCELLWRETANALARQGHSVTVARRNLPQSDEAVTALRQQGCATIDLPHGAAGALRLHRALLFSRPDFALVSLPLNVAGASAVRRIRRHGIRYAIVCQQAGDLYPPRRADFDLLRQAYVGAEFAGFVSDHNRRLTEQQLGVAIGNAVIVRNPFNVPWREREDWPGHSPFRLACVARLFAAEKGQDLLLGVLARPKWRSRPLAVSLFGEGEDRAELERLAAARGLDTVTFRGFEPDVAGIWSAHHGLVLPSRIEGLPLALVETMLSARVPIVTPAGGNAEVVRDGETGFVADAPTEEALDAAMERAWAVRGDWRMIGRAASAAIRSLVPEHPELDLAALLLKHAER
jgi:glycosyltransferase involved in cell wall biosynthesis